MDWQASIAAGVRDVRALGAPRAVFKFWDRESGFWLFITALEVGRVFLADKILGIALTRRFGGLLGGFRHFVAAAGSGGYSLLPGDSGAIRGKVRQRLY
jgi:hypothetical protein